MDDRRDCRSAPGHRRENHQRVRVPNRCIQPIQHAHVLVVEVDVDVAVERAVGTEQLILSGRVVGGEVDDDIGRRLESGAPPAELAPSCGANGVLGVLPGTMGLLQATEVIKLILDIGEPAIGRLLLYDALGATLTEVKVHRDPECPICSRPPEEITDEELGVFPDYEAFCAAAG